jgi:hypothetical protein
VSRVDLLLAVRVGVMQHHSQISRKLRQNASRRGLEMYKKTNNSTNAVIGCGHIKFRMVARTPPLHRRTA